MLHCVVCVEVAEPPVPVQPRDHVQRHAGQARPERQSVREPNDGGDELEAAAVRTPRLVDPQTRRGCQDEIEEGIALEARDERRAVEDPRHVLASRCARPPVKAVARVQFRPSRHRRTTRPNATAAIPVSAKYVTHRCSRCSKSPASASPGYRFQFAA
jgi:hypothetical protein